MNPLSTPVLVTVIVGGVLVALAAIAAAVYCFNRMLSYLSPTDPQLRDRLAELDEIREALAALQARPDATLEAFQERDAEIRTLKARVAAQEAVAKRLDVLLTAQANQLNGFAGWLNQIGAFFSDTGDLLVRRFISWPAIALGSIIGIFLSLLIFWVGDAPANMGGLINLGLTLLLVALSTFTFGGVGGLVRLWRTGPIGPSSTNQA